MARMLELEGLDEIVDVKLEAEDQGLLVEASGHQDANPRRVREKPGIDM